MPFKANADRRHRIPRSRYRATSGSAYDAVLRDRGSLTVWFTEAAIEAWWAEPRTTRGGQARYSTGAISTALTLRAVLRLRCARPRG
ncbi:Transposase (plasmid) [Roseomonas mucosa]|uniref:Transposase n=1 Tax=Roseomonas mucosa TaxID=207340 RepID=A0A4Y1MRB6_9PROT|nr:Transposase [Roseomonas mucosa]QDD97131.1 Transposase [Roseomonas mucosa]